MKLTLFRSIVPLLLLAAPLVFKGMELSGKHTGSVEITENFSIRVVDQHGHAVEFQPEFRVMYRDDDPRLAVRPGRVPGISYSVATWFTGTDADEVVGRAADLSRTMGDGWDPNVLAGDQEGRTADYLSTAASMVIRPIGIEWVDDRYVIHFREDGNFRLKAWLTPETEAGSPKIEYEFKALRNGHYSVGFSGCPSVDPDEKSASFLAPLWTRNYFPDRSYMTLAFRKTLPTSLVENNGRTVGIVADPALLPFQPLPLLDNSRFGFVLRNEVGNAQPMFFAPVLGGEGSKMANGDSIRASFYLISNPEPLYETYRSIATDIYGVHDYRRNDFTSLNDTLRNMTAYGLSEYSRFNRDLRGSSYETDVPGTVNNVTPLFPLSMAYVLDDEAIYWDRFVPMLEAGLSRTRRLFTTDPEVRGQGAVHTLNGPNIKGSELAALYRISGGKNAAFLTLAKAAGQSVPRGMALHNVTGQDKYLAEVLQSAGLRARAYLENPPREFSRVGFWTSWSPWMLMTDLFERTGECLFYQAALEGVREFVQFVYACPVVPEGEITVNEGGKAPLYWYMEQQGKVAMLAEERSMPAWRASEIGLTCESSATSYGHRAIFMVSHAPWMLRLAAMSEDPFLEAMARSSIVGRYASFPGYHINTARTDVYEKADYPLRDHMELSYNSFHYNHVWPHIALLLDYMVSDIEVLSGGEIRFPTLFGHGYAYMENRVFYPEKGTVMGEPAQLWMPLDLIECDQVEFNWIAARGDDQIHLVVTNQSHEERTGRIRINSDRVRLGESTQAVLRVHGQSEAKRVAVDEIKLTLPPRGLGVVTVLDATPSRITFQDRLGQGRVTALNAPVDLKEEDGQLHFLSMGRELNSIYLFCRDFTDTTSKVILQYRFDSDRDWTELRDGDYPFEFTVRVPEERSRIEFKLTKIDVSGRASEFAIHKFDLWQTQ